jgi:hypothetical protein
MGMAAYIDSSRTAAEDTLAVQANDLFLQLIKIVPGVVHVEPFGGVVAGEQSFRVYVRDGDPEAERAVYQTKGAVYDRYPDAGLDVEVLEESDLPQASHEAGPVIG